jgi:hypothetical protein
VFWSKKLATFEKWKIQKNKKGEKTLQLDSRPKNKII